MLAIYFNETPMVTNLKKKSTKYHYNVVLKTTVTLMG